MHGFKQFILRGNVVDLAVGVLIGAAFGNVVNALAKDILTPLISAIAKIPDLSNLSFTIRGSVFMYGDFINNLISFAISAVTIYFFVVLPINKLIASGAHLKDKLHGKHEGPLVPDLSTKKCPECLSDIPFAAKRCAHCTVVL